MLFKHFCVYYLQNCILFAFLLDISMDVKTQTRVVFGIYRNFSEKKGQPFHSKQIPTIASKTLRRNYFGEKNSSLMCDIRID